MAGELIPHPWPKGRWRLWNDEWAFIGEHDGRPPDDELMKASAVTIDFADGRPRWSGKVCVSVELINYEDIDRYVSHLIRMTPIRGDGDLGYDFREVFDD